MSKKRKKYWLDVKIPNGCLDMSIREEDQKIEKYTAYFTSGCKTQKKPHAIIAVGIPGAGKSTLIKRFSKRGYAFANPDNAVTILPEYKRGLKLSTIFNDKLPIELGSSRMRVDCIDLGYKIYHSVINTALTYKYNIIIDMPFSYDHIPNLIYLGYKVTVLYVISDKSTSEKRIISRALVTGMFHDTTISKMKKNFKKNKLYDSIVDTLQFLLPFVNQVIVCDNRGKTPKCTTYNNNKAQIKKILDMWQKRMKNVDC